MSLLLFSMITANGSPEAVDMLRLALEGASARWFSVVKYAGYAVAIGCAAEVPETLIAVKRWWLLRFRGEDREETLEQKRSFWKPTA